MLLEIGQGLLHKHETFVTESNQQKTQLEKQVKKNLLFALLFVPFLCNSFKKVEECHERITGLEQSLDEVENQKDSILKEKNRWFWEYQKRQKVRYGKKKTWSGNSIKTCNRLWMKRYRI